MHVPLLALYALSVSVYDFDGFILWSPCLFKLLDCSSKCVDGVFVVIACFWKLLLMSCKWFWWIYYLLFLVFGKNISYDFSRKWFISYLLLLLFSKLVAMSYKCFNVCLCGQTLTQPFNNVLFIYTYMLDNLIDQQTILVLILCLFLKVWFLIVLYLWSLFLMWL